MLGIGPISGGPISALPYAPPPPPTHVELDLVLRPARSLAAVLCAAGMPPVALELAVAPPVALAPAGMPVVRLEPSRSLSTRLVPRP